MRRGDATWPRRHCSRNRRAGAYDIDAIQGPIIAKVDDLYDEEVTAADGSVATTLPCPVCAATAAATTFRLPARGLDLVTCAGCDLGSLHPLPDRETIRGFYPSSYYGHGGLKLEPVAEALVRVVANRMARFLARGLPAGARVLDVGCGRGTLLAALADRGLEAHGVEITAEAAAGIDPRAQLRVAETLAEARYPDAFFDRAVLWHVLEHLADPAATVHELRRVLKPGGMLVIAVPNFSSWQARWSGPAWFHLDPPRHIFHFPLAALERLLTQAGFRVQSAHHFSLRQNPFGWVQSALNRVPSLPRNGIYRLLQRRPPGSPPPFTRGTRFVLRAAYYLGMGPAVLLSMIAAAARRGATVHVVAEAPADGR